MIYRFSEFLQLNYNQLAGFLNDEEELSKSELLERCTGKISFDLLQVLKELEFECVGKTSLGELYLT